MRSNKLWAGLARVLTFLVVIVWGDGELQSQHVQWVTTVMGPGMDHANCVALDPTGNMLVSGNGEGIFNLGQKVLHTRGCTDPFLARYDANLNPIWAKTFGSMICDYASSMCTDPQGNMYFLTMMNYDAHYDSLVIPYTEGETSIAKVDVNGNLVWARHYGGEEYIYIRSELVYRDGKLFLSGNFKDSLVVGGQTLLRANDNDEEGFVMQLDTMGNVNWVRHAFSYDDFEMNALDVDAQGNCYVTGWFRGLTYFGSFVIPGPGGLLLAKLSPSGQVDWVRVLTGFLYDEYAQLKLGPQGDIYLASTTDSTVYLDSMLVVPDRGLFLMRLDSLGSFKWQVQGESQHALSAYALAVDSYGNAYLGGTFRSTFKMGGFVFPSANRWSYNTYLATIRHDGEVEEVSRIKGPGTAFAQRLFLYGDTALYFTGHFSDTVYLGSHQLVSVGAWDGFYAKLMVAPMTGVAVEPEDRLAGLLRIYPNPVQDEFRLEASGLAGKQGRVTMFDVEGRLVQEVWDYREGDAVKIVGLPRGVYGVRLEGLRDGSVAWGKVVVLGTKF